MSNNNCSTNNCEDVHKLGDLIKDIDFGMLTTMDEDGSLRSRPMSVNGKVEFDGDIWFFTYGNSHKVIEAENHPQVNVSFTDINKQNYVSLSGTAELVRDKAKIEELWLPELKAWFPEGVDTPDIALLKINGQKAEYWDGPSSMISHAVALLKGMAGESPDIGENKKINLKH